MARYFFHLRDGTDVALDEEGRELSGFEAVRRAALQGARDTLSHDMKAGRLDLRLRIEVENEHGAVLYSLPMQDAFEVIER